MAKKITHKMRKPTEWENIFANYVTGIENI